MRPLTEWPIGGPEIFDPVVLSPLSWSALELPPAWRAGRGGVHLEPVAFLNWVIYPILPEEDTNGNIFILQVPSSAGNGVPAFCGAMGLTKTILFSGLDGTNGNLYVKMAAWMATGGCRSRSSRIRGPASRTCRAGFTTSGRGAKAPGLSWRGRGRRSREFELRMRGLILTPDRDSPGRGDFRGAFGPEADRLCAAHALGPGSIARGPRA